MTVAVIEDSRVRTLIRMYVQVRIKDNGLEMLERIVEFDPVIDVIMITAHYTTTRAAG